jgi:uncharacterized membrane protein (DUF485 family)
VLTLLLFLTACLLLRQIDSYYSDEMRSESIFLKITIVLFFVVYFVRSGFLLITPVFTPTSLYSTQIGSLVGIYAWDLIPICWIICYHYKAFTSHELDQNFNSPYTSHDNSSITGADPVSRAISNHSQSFLSQATESILSPKPSSRRVNGKRRT